MVPLTSLWIPILPNGGHPMGRTFALWFVYCILVGAFAAFIAGRALPPHTGFREVLILGGVAAFGGHALGMWPAAIWYGKALGATMRSTIDGVVYAVVTGLVFAWLWP